MVWLEWMKMTLFWHIKKLRLHILQLRRVTTNKLWNNFSNERTPNVALGNAYYNSNMYGEFMVYDLVLKVLQKLKSLDFHSALWGGTTDALVSKKRQCSYCI